MRGTWKHGIALTSVIGLLLTGCSDADPEQSSQDQAASDQSAGAGATPDGEAAPDDPNENVEDGVYRGHGVTLPVPDGWTLDPAAIQQGVVAATSENGAQQLTARAIDIDQAQTSGAEPVDLETLLDGVRQQIDDEAETDESVSIDGADRAHRLTYLQLAGPQEGTPETSATIVLAEAANLMGEFAYTAEADSYDTDVASLLVEEAGFDPDSEPPALPEAPQPAPDTGGGDTGGGSGGPQSEESQEEAG